MWRSGLLSLVAGLHDLALARRLDVADDRRPHPRDPDLLGHRPALARPRVPPRRRAGDARGNDDAADRQARQGALRALARAGEDDINGLLAIHADPELRALHEDWLPTRRPRQRGQITADRAMAEAKLADAETIEDAVDWLNRGERLVALSDRALIGMIARLPRRAALASAAQESARAAE